MKQLIALFSLSLVLATPALAQKIRIEKADDLPRYTYQIEGKASELVQDRDAIMALAAKVKSDLEADLETYEIPDATTLQGYYGTLRTIAYLDGRREDVLELSDKIRALEDKKSVQLTSGLLIDAMTIADGDQEAFTSALQERVADLPFEIVQDNIESGKGSMEILSANLVIGQIQAGIDPVVVKTDGEISKQIAQSLIGAHLTITEVLPMKDGVVRIYGAYLAANATEKADIWAAREVAIDAGAPGQPIVAIWDSGIDVGIRGLGAQLWTNENEIAGNGVDDDDNGFVDDVHGIGYDLEASKVTEPLASIEELDMPREQMQGYVKGLMDMQANIDSDEASAVKQTIASLNPEQVQPFIESISAYSGYSHGTHVAGIASAGNPNVRLMNARITFDYRIIPDTPTMADAHRAAAAAYEIIDYFKQNGVRVVNMSWGGSVSGVEAALEANGEGGTPEERKALARKIFNVQLDALRAAMASAPEILFIAAAGNSDNNNEFDEFIPSSIDLPNMMTVAAVDQAGEEASFTTLGKVDVHANGFEVDSYVPGGDRLKFSGTSMAAPNVANLAGKLLALDPSLDVAALRELIEESADERVVGERTFRLINPRQAVENLEKRKAG